MDEKWYVFLNQDTSGYEVNQLGKQAARSVPISVPNQSAALAHDNVNDRSPRGGGFALARPSYRPPSTMAGLQPPDRQ